MLLPLSFSTRFLLSLLIVLCNGKPLMTKSKTSQLLSLVLVICGRWLPMVLNVVIPILSSTFCPKSTLILLPLLWLLKGDPWLPWPHLSIEALACLASMMSLLPNCTLPIVKYSDPIVVTDNKRCSILVRSVSVNWSIVDIDICLAIFFPNVVVNDGISRLLR